jgi:hypothetical protein
VALPPQTNPAQANPPQSNGQPSPQPMKSNGR